jgi:hypothetical protein
MKLREGFTGAPPLVYKGGLSLKKEGPPSDSEGGAPEKPMPNWGIRRGCLRSPGEVVFAEHDLQRAFGG